MLLARWRHAAPLGNMTYACHHAEPSAAARLPALG